MPPLSLIGTMPRRGLDRIPWNTIARASLVGIALSVLAFLPEFAEHTRAHFTGSISEDMITDRWHVVVLNISVFVAFLLPLSYRRKADWKEYGLVVAFFVSLFVEMYGVPFILLFVSQRLAPEGAATPDTPVIVDFLGVEFAFTVPMLYGTLLMAIGTALVVVAWYQLYKGVQRSELVTTGLYAVSRNPQYLGFMLVIIGWVVGWPTILTVAFAPILLVMYTRLCYVEQREVGDLPGYDEYRERVPLII
jgi:protein-S-isoprenylcysteine O-methyltransferase Ste14